jgi:hypothetical protein
MQVPAGGGDPDVLYKPTGSRQAWWPQLLGDGKAVLFTVVAAGAAADLDAAELQVLTLATGDVKTVVSGAAAGHMLDSGHLVFIRGGAL